MQTRAGKNAIEMPSYPLYFYILCTFSVLLHSSTSFSAIACSSAIAIAYELVAPLVSSYEADQCTTITMQL
jgi:hypothetical protein